VQSEKDFVYRSKAKTLIVRFLDNTAMQIGIG
jgi:hypothetical protein